MPTLCINIINYKTIFTKKYFYCIITIVIEVQFMKERILVIIKCLIMLVIALVLFMGAKEINEKGNNLNNASLIIYGDTISTKYKPIVENDKIYLSTSTIGEFIDDEIFYDNNTKKVIITTEDAVYKFQVDNNIATKNLKEYDAKSCCKVLEDKVYVDMEMVKNIYKIKCQYDTDTQTISIDKLDTSDLHLNYNKVNLYNDLNTKSDIIEILDTDDTVTVYTESLKHNRWYKVKSDSGKIGYVEKSAVTIDKETKEDDTKNGEETKEKLIMFWQYGSSLDTLGDKIEGVNVVMPTWYAISDNEGSVEINYNKEYYNKAKKNGYEIWPIITNGLDNAEMNKKQVTSDIMNDESRRENLIRNIVSIINTNDLDGINIDFEGMIEEDKYMYTQFLRELYPLVKEAGAKLSVDIYFTNYIDRQGVGKACDYVMLMGYDQRGNWSKEPGSISEINWVEKNINSLINDSNIPESKIILGVPFYTRLWKVESDGTFTTNVYSMKNSQEFLEKYNLTPTMDNISGQNYVAMNLGDITYKLWIEDKESISKRADTVINYNLAGITAWQKGFETEDIWELLREKLK